MVTDYGNAYARAVASELRAARVRRKYPAAQLAADINVDPATLSRYLNGHRDIPMPIFLDLCRALRVDAGRIFDDARHALELDEQS